MISIIIPVIRPDKAQICIEAIRRNAGDIEYEIISEIDVDGIGCPKMVAQLTDKASGDRIMFLGDDTEPEPGFLQAAVDAMLSLPDGWGVVGLNTQDEVSGYNDRAHWMAHRKMLKHIPGGYFFPTEYHHCFCDDELKDIAIELSRWSFAEGCRIKHHHPINKTAEYDAGYQKAYDSNFYHDQQSYYRRKITRRGLGIGVGVPLTGNTVHRRFASSYRQAMYSFLTLEGRPRIVEYEPDVPIGEFAREVANNRNDIIRQALNDGISHIIMMDSDQIYPPDVIIKLSAWAARGREFVAAPVHRRYEPFEAIMMRGRPDAYEHIPDEEKYSGGLIMVDAVGSGCIMFSTLRALEISPPWFELMPTPKGEQMGEDIAFCSKMRSIGVDIWVDTSITIDHIAEIAVNREFHEIWKKLYRKTIGGI